MMEGGSLFPWRLWLLLSYGGDFFSLLPVVLEDLFFYCSPKPNIQTRLCPHFTPLSLPLQECYTAAFTQLMHIMMQAGPLLNKKYIYLV